MWSKYFFAILLLVQFSTTIFAADTSEADKALALFKKVDANGDQKVTKAEARKLLDGKEATAYAAKFGKSVIKKSFDQLVGMADQDGDGAISREELDAALARLIKSEGAKKESEDQ